MNLREQFIAPHYNGMATDLRDMAMTDPEAARERFLTNGRHELCEAYGFSRREQSKPFAFANGIAIIPVHGTLINRFGGFYGSVTGYNFIRTQFNAAMADDDVKAIVFDHNSYGGEAAGCFELSAEIAAGRGKKPMLAMIDSNCYSASYALATAADKIAMIPSAGVGSVGVVAMHVDMSKALADWGITVTFIHSGDHKVDGNPYEALSKDVKADIQMGVNKSRAKFVSVVAGNMGLDEKVVYDTEARTYRADDALKLGLVHAVAVPSVALQSLINGDDPDQSGEGAEILNTKEQNMAGEDKDKATVDQAAVQKAERERISGIMNCEEAKGRSKLASHFALNTSMSVDDAKAALGAAASEVAVVTKTDEAAGGGDNTGKEKADATAAAAAAAAAKDTAFESAMSKTGGAGVGADNTAAAQGENLVSDIVQSFNMASGHKFGAAAAAK